MGKKEILELLVDGGAAKAGAQMGMKLGPMGVNINDVLAKINEKTRAFAGMKVPVKVIVDVETRQFELEIGTPPASQLVLKELGIKKGSGKPNSEFIGDLSMEQVKKIAEMKKGSSLSRDADKIAREIIGTCVSMGVKIEGKDPRDFFKKEQ